MFSSGRSARLAQMQLELVSIASWPRRRWLVTVAGTMVAALIVGVPTGIVRTSFFTRMTPVTWWDYPVWALSAVLGGLTAATYVRADGAQSPANRSGRALSGALLCVFAVGCPICNQLVVALIGLSGALDYWAPIQPVLGLLSLGLLATGLAFRLRGAVSCSVPRTD